MNNPEKGFAIIIALLIVAIMSAVAATAFFISTADLKISFNRLEAAKSLRDAERVVAEVEKNMEQCLSKNNVQRCVSEIEDSVGGAANAVSVSANEFSFSAIGRVGNSLTEIELEYSAHNGRVTINSWRQKVGKNQ